MMLGILDRRTFRKLRFSMSAYKIKQARGFRQFLRRGVRKVQQEWALVCLAHNLCKLHTAMGLV